MRIKQFMIHDSSEIYIIMYVLGSLSILMRRILNSSFAFFPLHMSTCRNHQQTFVIQNSTFPNWWAAEDITSNLTFAEWIYYTYFVTSMDLTFQKFSSRLKSCKARGGTYFFETPPMLIWQEKIPSKSISASNSRHSSPPDKKKIKGAHCGIFSNFVAFCFIKMT